MPKKRPGRSAGGGTDVQRTDTYGEGGPEAAFNLWLWRRLRELFGSADAPVPDALLRVIREDNAKRRQ